MYSDEQFKESCCKLGNNIKKLREEKNITIREMSDKTGIRKEYLKKIESGEAYGVCLEKHMSAIAHALNVKLSELFNF